MLLVIIYSVGNESCVFTALPVGDGDSIKSHEVGKVCQPVVKKCVRFFLIKPTDALVSQIYFCQETLHFSGSSSAHHQEFSTVHSALVYVMMVVLESCHQTCMTITSAECTVENS